MKFLSLCSLIVVHAVSWVNQIKREPIDGYWGFVGLKIFVSFSVFFLILAGISFYLNHREDLKQHRLISPTSKSVIPDLLRLIFISCLVDVILYQTPASIYYWSFFKALLVAYVLIRYLGRLSLWLILAAGLVIHNGTYALMKLLEPLVIPTVGQSILVDALYWFWLLLPVLLLAGGTIRRIADSSVPLATKRFVFVSQIIVLVFWVLFVYFQQPKEHDYMIVVNWWRDALVGSPEFVNFYVIQVWVPLVLYSFLGAYIGFRYETIVSRHFRWVLFVNILLFGVFYALAYYTVPFENVGNISLWDFTSYKKPFWQVQILTMVTFTGLYLLFVAWNKCVSRGNFDKVIENWSVSSFWLYLTVLAFGRPLAKAFSGFSLFTASVLTIITVAIACEVATRAFEVLRRKRIRLVLTQS